VRSSAGPVLVLVGPPGSGKSTVGRLAADRLGVGFRDTDADVEAAAGTPVAEIFVEQGEDQFRALEYDAVRRALAEHRGVLAVGSGAVLDRATRHLLRSHPVVFLAVGLADALRRLGLARDRPAALGSPRAQLLLLLQAREPLYAEVAEVTVDTDGRTPAQVADAVLVGPPPVPAMPGAASRTDR